MVSSYQYTHPGSYQPGSQRTTYDPSKGRVIVNPATGRAINQGLRSTDTPVNAETINTARRIASAYNMSSSLGTVPSSPADGPMYLSGGGGGGWGGGGGGGGGGAGGLTQAQLDWMSNLLAQGQPTGIEATRVKLPRGKFQGQRYNQLTNRFNRAVGLDQATANRAYANLNTFLQGNYRNAFANPQAAQAQGTTPVEMARMAQQQGLGSEVAGAQMEGAAAGNAAFSNLWDVLRANEDLAQRNRLTTARQNQLGTNTALDIAALQGRTGIGLQRQAARDEWRAQNMQTRQQQALMNWQRANQVQDTNAQLAASYRNQAIQALLGMVPQQAAGTNLPDLNEILGLPAPKETEPTKQQQNRRRYYRTHKGEASKPGPGKLHRGKRG